MMVWALDLGKRTGVAAGDPENGLPRVEAVTLRGTKDVVHVQARNLACFLRDRWSLGKPDLIIVESALNPAASKSADATISQLLCHGAIHAMAGVYGVRVETVAPATARKHFCGRATAAPRRKAPRTSQQAREDREATNNMVLRRAISLRYLPHGCADWDKASAAALWDWAVAKYTQDQPRDFVFFEEEELFQ
jgi:hypothetical protein